MSPAPGNQPPSRVETFTVSRTTFNYVVACGIFLIVGLIAGGLLFGRGLSRSEMMRLLDDAIAGSSGTGMSSARLVDDDPVLGPEDAPVTLVEFSDFNCPACTHHATQTFDRLVAHYGDNLRIVYRDYPVIGGQLSVEAAEAANCANEQGKFWEFHKLLFSYPTARDAAAYTSFAQELSINSSEFGVCLSTRRYASEVNLDYADGMNLGLNSTPSFFINDLYVRGAESFDFFADVIDRELKRLGIEPPPRVNRG